MVVPPNIQTPSYTPTKPARSESSWESYPTAWSTPCHFGIPTFLHVLKDLTVHPERNSSLILRADPLPIDTTALASSSASPGKNKSQAEDADRGGDELDEWLTENGLEKVEEVRVRLMPKQPQRDTKLDQRVLFYRTPEKIEHEHPPKIINNEGANATDNTDRTRSIKGKGKERERAVVIMIPLVKDMEAMPFYHPPVRRVVFLYEAIETEDVVEQMENLSVKPDEAKAGEDNPIRGHLSISYLPFDTPISPNSDDSTLAEPLLAPLAGIRRTSLPRKRSPLAGPPSNTDAGNASAKINKEDPKTVEARLHRTLLALLERVYKHGFGTMIGYKKRVNHDVSSPPPSPQYRTHSRRADDSRPWLRENLSRTFIWR